MVGDGYSGKMGSKGSTKSFWIDAMNPLEHIPSTMLRPLPANATSDAKLRNQIDLLGQKLPDSMGQVAALLEQVKVSSDYDAAVNRAAGHVWSALDLFYTSEDPSVRVALLRFSL